MLSAPPQPFDYDGFPENTKHCSFDMIWGSRASVEICQTSLFEWPDMELVPIFLSVS